MGLPTFIKNRLLASHYPQPITYEKEISEPTKEALEESVQIRPLPPNKPKNK